MELFSGKYGAFSREKQGLFARNARNAHLFITAALLIKSGDVQCIVRLFGGRYRALCRQMVVSFAKDTWSLEVVWGKEGVVTSCSRRRVSNRVSVCPHILKSEHVLLVHSTIPLRAHVEFVKLYGVREMIWSS